MFKDTAFGPTFTEKTTQADGSVLLKLKQPLAEFPEKLTQKLIECAKKEPNTLFLMRRNPADGNWKGVTYAETLEKVRAIAQYLLNLHFSEDETIVILSENSIEHALLALAAVHIGIPYSPISPPYSLVSNDFGKLKHCLEVMTPKVIFAQNGNTYAQALSLAKRLFPEAKIVTVEETHEIHFAELLTAVPTEAVETAYSNVNEDTVAKVLFTSGSTGLPKGVINTQRMWCANLQQITQVFPFMASEPPVFVDWLPWNHTFGGNHNFGLTLYNGGTLYMDEGKPTPKGIETTVQNLRGISPTAYFNVPKGFEMLIPYFEKEPELRQTFFKNLHILFYAGASLAQPVWNRLEELALETIGQKVPIITGLGCTESGPSAMFASWHGAYSGLLGVPVAGMSVKLVPDGDKTEARYKAPNVTPGYWRNPEATANAFDEEGYYKTGDAVKFVDENNPDKGLVFDGRIAEDFKLSTGTWVNVGVLKAKVLTAGSPIVQDVVLAGLDRDYIGAILFLNPDACRKLAALEESVANDIAFQHESVQKFIDEMLARLQAQATGSATLVAKAVIAVEPPSIDLGEITDKGSLNQRAVLKYRADLVEKLYG
ncbi:feruloyl-CoA synthase [Runella slithyformis]|uniref:Long-chain-fatty-acid--CoA ligase n=1 Tax=Runella slithyformis (strain ATCC 29530 / DSM 19594 / LMG 11500 / NCIMB 11436 / LSU 4) TaxID=761193 RepID=A0A7U3ZGT0_RUNSL|nr:feruloyl-CoA synthase [Runella slithyformis]AEI46954.1 Long-chain-fatty-acid--CoA ligase [Runella slithyformis DSM 19594]